MTHRRPIPYCRHHLTHNVRMAAQRSLYLSVHGDKQPAEVFLRIKGPDCSSELIGLYAVIARLMSIALQDCTPHLRRSAIALLGLNLPHAAGIRKLEEVDLNRPHNQGGRR